MLTERIVRDAKPGLRTTILWDGLIQGLGCKVYPSGRTTYVLSYRTGGRKRLAALGRYPDLSLRDARELAREELAQIRNGDVDPLERRRRRREAPTVNDALTKFFDETVPQRIAAGCFTERTAREYTGFVTEHTVEGAAVYTDDASAYEGLPRPHETVKHSVSEYVRGQVHTNGMESFWSILKRGYIGTYHKMSPKHLNQYVTEFAGRQNFREFDTIEQMGCVARGMLGKRLQYGELVAPNGLDSGTRGA